MKPEVERPTDICECGDYRHQHEHGSGPCHMPDDLSHGFKPCTAFRFQRAVDETLVELEPGLFFRREEWEALKALKLRHP